jgi:hypothetical protein
MQPVLPGGGHPVQLPLLSAGSVGFTAAPLLAWRLFPAPQLTNQSFKSWVFADWDGVCRESHIQSHQGAAADAVDNGSIHNWSSLSWWFAPSIKLHLFSCQLSSTHLAFRQPKLVTDNMTVIITAAAATSSSGQVLGKIGIKHCQTFHRTSPSLKHHHAHASNSTFAHTQMAAALAQHAMCSHRHAFQLMYIDINAT